MQPLSLAPAALWLAAAAAAQTPLYEAEFVFPLDRLHNHSSSLVELPDGQLLVAWYRGSGERNADDVAVLGARRPPGPGSWSEPFVLADTAGFPDCNPALFLDAGERLWLFWPVILANEWHTALLKYRISSDYRRPGPPAWFASEAWLAVPRNFQAKVKQAVEGLPAGGGQGAAAEYRKRLLERAGDKYFTRMGWMPRNHPLQLPSGRILAPLYSDGFSFSLIAVTDDGGASWTTSEPLVGAGAVQPTLVRRRDGTLVAYMRDNGPPPKRVMTAVSRDDGLSWSAVTDTDIPNPGSSLEVIALRDGTWVMVYNDTERGRHSLAVALSEDEGATWKWKRHLELDRRPQGAGSFHYPSLIQARDGTLHVTYSYFLNHLPASEPRKTIKHARFDVAWIRQGDQ
jgi:predicted neuraminidase